MVSAVVNFARYGALVVGVGYGAWRAQHLRSVEAHAREAHAHAAEIKAHKQAAAAAAAPHTGVVSDPSSPQFDLEKYLLSLSGPSASKKH